MGGDSCACGHCAPMVAETTQAQSHAQDHTHGGARREALFLGVSGVFLALGLLLPLGEFWRVLLLSAAYLTAGWQVLLHAGRGLLRGRVFDESFLMALASIGAICLGDFPEAATVMLFYGVGELFQGLAAGRSRRSIRALMDIRPDRATRLVDGTAIPCAAEDVLPGELILVKAGERLPLDGVVTTGVSELDTSALTGESMPRAVEPGDEVSAGWMNGSGTLTVTVSRPFGESTAAKVIALAEQAGERKAKTERFITRFARIYTPCVVVAAALLVLIPGAITGDWAEYLRRALVFLVASCPCALALSIPMTFFAGIGCASRNGILVRSGGALETLAKVGTVVFDKTGTLTTGAFRVIAAYPAAQTEAELREVAAHAELNSNHPIAVSLRAAFDGVLDPSRVSDVQEWPGGGVMAIVDGRQVLLGNRRLLERHQIPLSDMNCKGTLLYMAVDGIYAGALEIADLPKAEAAESIAALKSLGVKRTVLLTGDRQTAGEWIGNELGIDEVRGDLLPDGKVEAVEKLLTDKACKGKLLYAGDGMNDAPVLARADLGVAMGGVGSDAAIEAADVVVMDDSLLRLPKAIRIARRTGRIAAQNIVFALGVKAVVLVLGSLSYGTMWLAVFADVGVSLLAVLNAMRALKA